MFFPPYNSNNLKFVRRVNQLNNKHFRQIHNQSTNPNKFSDLINFCLMGILGSVNGFYLYSERKPEYNQIEKQNRIMSSTLLTFTVIGCSYHLLRFLKK
jgi:hypothetical protein